jgi:hypothetical protein
MKGHVDGPLVAGQKVQVTVDGRIERNGGAWEVSCGGYALPLDLDGIVSVEFLDGDKPQRSINICSAKSPTLMLRCEAIEGHGGVHTCGWNSW